MADKPTSSSGLDRIYELLARSKPSTGRKPESPAAAPPPEPPANVTQLLKAVAVHPTAAAAAERSARRDAEPAAAPKIARRPGEELTKNIPHPAALDAWKDVLVALERCVEVVISEENQELPDRWQDADEQSRALIRLCNFALPVPIKQRLLAVTMLLYPRLPAKERDRLVQALEHIPSPTRRHLRDETVMSDHDAVEVRSLVRAVEAACNLPVQLHAMLRCLARRIGLYPAFGRPVEQPA